MQGRPQVIQEVIAWATELALPHRLKHTPFQAESKTGESIRPLILERLGLTKTVATDDLGIGAFMDETELRAPDEDESSPWMNLRTGLL